MAGKGSKPRPREVDAETFARNWDRIFGNKPERKKPEHPDGPCGDPYCPRADWGCVE